MSVFSRLIPFSWLKLWFPALNAKLVKTAISLNTNTYAMAFTSQQTIDFLDEVLLTLQTSRATTQTALAAAKEAKDALEPLKSENSRISAAVNSLETQISAWESQDAAEDAAMARVKAFLDTPVEPPAVVPEVPPVDSVPVTPPLTQADDLPVGLPPVTTPVEVPTADGVDLTGDLDANDTVEADEALTDAPVDEALANAPVDEVSEPTEELLDPIPTSKSKKKGK